jgi:hypothetical protein
VLCHHKRLLQLCRVRLQFVGAFRLGNCTNALYATLHNGGV